MSEMSDINNMPDDFFRGEKVRLRMMTPAESAENGVRWTQSTEYYRLLDDEPMVPASLEQTRKHVEAHQSKTFAIELLDPAGTIIGFTALWKCETPGGDGWLAIGIGDSEHRGAGRGVDALKILARYAFDALQLHRISLSVFEYNTRAMRAYEKAGFVHEGRIPQLVRRDGRRWDMLLMGLLASDWRA